MQASESRAMCDSSPRKSDERRVLGRCRACADGEGSERGGVSRGTGEASEPQRDVRETEEVYLVSRKSKTSLKNRTRVNHVPDRTTLVYLGHFQYVTLLEHDLVAFAPLHAV